MTEDHLSKLKEAIEIIVKGQLKDNHDDTLIEKLLTHVKKLIHTRNGLEVEERRQLQQFVFQLIDGQDIPDPVSLQLMAFFISPPEVFGSPTRDSELAMTKFAMLACAVDSKSDLSLQSSLIKSLSLFAESDWLISGQLYSLPPVNFLRIIYDLMMNSPSYFVRNDAEQLLVSLLIQNRPNSILDYPSESTHLTAILQLISSDPNAKHLQFLKLVLEKSNTRRYLVKLNVREAIVKHFEIFCDTEFPNDKVFQLFCHVLGLFVLRPDSVEQVFAMCRKRNDLKGLGIFSSRLLQVDREYINKWLLYSLYTLVAKTERRSEIAEQMLASLREKAFVERLADSSVVMTVLQMMPCVFRNVDEKGSLIVEALQVFLQTNLVDKKKLFDNRKTISEAIACLAKCSREDLVIEVDFNEIICNLIVLTEPHSDSHLIELLTVARNFWKEKLLFNLFGNVAVEPILDSMVQVLTRPRFHKPLTSWTENEDNSSEKEIEVLESVFDALSQLTANASFGEHEKFLQVLVTLWNLHRENLNFLIAIVPVMSALDTLATEGELLKFDLEKHKSIPELFSSCLKREEDALTLKIVSTLRENIERFNYLKSRNSDAFDDLLSSLCFASLRVLDSGIQSEIFGLLLEIMNPNSVEEVKRFYRCGLMTTAMLVIESDLHASNDVRVTVFEISELLKNCIRWLNLDENSLKTQLQNTSSPLIFREASIDHTSSQLPAAVTRHEKVKAIEKLFQGQVNQPTQDMILELKTVKEETCDSSSTPNIPVANSNLSHLVKFYTDQSVYSQPENLSDCIIDDIIAAKLVPNAASIDCY